MHENEQRRPGLDALVSDAGRRREEIAPPMEYTEIAAPVVSPPAKPRSARKRIVKTKMSDSEYRTFLARVKRSELSASEFLRRAALTEKFVAELKDAIGQVQDLGIRHRQYQLGIPHPAEGVEFRER